MKLIGDKLGSEQKVRVVIANYRRPAGRMGSQKPRPLNAEERALLSALVPSDILVAQGSDFLECARVSDLMDGGMGSIRFDGSQQHRRRARAVAEARYVDDDGTPVSIEVNVDESNRLFEVDFWKVDFSPLRRYPEPHDLK